MYGWTGRLLRVNLTTGTSTTEEIKPQWRLEFLGGRGLGARILAAEVKPDTEPLGPENKLIFAVGPLTGTKVPTAGRFSVTAKSPLTGTIFDANAGGRWGVGLKRGGYDALVIEGRSSQPVYLAIQDGEVAVKDATDLWEWDVLRITEHLAQVEEQAAVACIGPAGVHQVLMAAIMTDRHRARGRGGIGAVMGSKNLKAITVRGNGTVPVADPDKLDYILDESDKWLKANPITALGLPEFGTPLLVNLINELGIFPVRNFQEAYFPQAEKISGETIAEKYTVRRAGCHGCAIACGRMIRGAAGETAGPEYESLWALGPQCGIDDLEVIMAANQACNRLGLDTISTGVTIGCAMELADRGLLANGPRFGDTAALVSLIEDIALRRGVGELLAQGSRRLARSRGAEEYAMQVKGLEFPAYDPRGLQGMGLNYATSNRGACHLRAYMVGPEVLGVPKLVDRLATGGKAGLAILHQNVSAAVDSLILCRFLGFAISEDYYARMLSAVTGENYQTQDLHRIGERVWNLERLYNLGAGLAAADDTLPTRLLEEPIPAGPSAGATVNLEPMLAEYYRFRGWNPAGEPLPGKVAALGLEEVFGA